MNSHISTPTSPYARALNASRKARFDLELDVFRDRQLEPDRKYLPDGLARIAAFDGLTEAERRLVSQIQGRTYANVFGLVERFINAKVLEVSREHALGDQVALEALIRFSDEELKHQEMFRRLEAMAERTMPAGYRFVAQPDELARAVLDKSSWAVLALTCHIELFTQVHYKESIEPDPQLSELYKDVFLHHFREESQHAVLDELEWRRADARLDEAEREQGVSDLLALVGALDDLLRAQADSDAEYFVTVSGRTPETAQQRSALFLSAYRFQYVVSGIQRTRFVRILTELIGAEQWVRVQQALAPLLAAP